MTMIVDVVRFSKKGDDSTPGIFCINGEFMCYSLERASMIIPELETTLTLQKSGKLNDEYTKKYGPKHHGMLNVKYVPGRSGIMIHVANYANQLLGCTATGNCPNSKGELMESEVAYLKIYPIIANELLAGKEVKIRYRNSKSILLGVNLK